MEIAMFMIFFVCNMFTVLIMKFAYESSYRYNNGMIIGVHIPGEHINDNDVTGIVTRFKKQMKYFQNINLLISTALCFLNFVSIILFIIVYVIWLIIFIAGVMFLLLNAHRRMYSLKLRNGWIIESQKQKVFIDTRACANADASPISFRYHIFIIAAEMLSLIPFFSWTDREYFPMIVIFAICTIAVSVFGLVFHVYMNRRQKQAYSLDSDINGLINMTMKKYIGAAMLTMSLLNLMAWAAFVLMCLIQNTVGDVSFWVYICMQLLSGFALAVILVLSQRRKNEMLKANSQPIFVDDDDYWKTGFYYNPNDPHLFVTDRLCSTNYSLNYARTGAKVFTGTITAILLGTLIWTIVVLAPFLHVTIDIKTTESTVNVSSCGYTSIINIDDITELKLMDELPDDHFFKSNGGATESYLVGRFKGNTYGKCSLYIFKDVSPVLLIKTDSQTVFINSKDDGEIVNLYNSLKNN